MTGQLRVGAWCCFLAIVYITSNIIDVSDAQAYHFSKGWMPGRKRSDTQLMGQSGSRNQIPMFGELDRLSEAEVCAVKSEGYQLALDILKEGFERLAEECEVAFALHDLSSASNKNGFQSSSGKSKDK